VGDINALQEVSVAPIYESSSGRETVGDIIDTATISSSAPGGNGNGGTPECDDGTDNDGDGNIDLNDAGCTGSSDDDETNCGDGICEGGEDVASCSSDCSGVTPPSCNGTWDGVAEDPGVECDGEPLPANCNLDCTCSAGFSADGAGGCDLEPVVNFGVIQGVFTSTEPFQFFSLNLPYWVEQNLQNHYVNFTGLGGVCKRIDFHHRVDDIDYVRLEGVTPGLTAGLDYFVWEAEYCGA
jgi:hypothetical protein